MKKTLCHPKALVSNPPRGGPRLMPRPIRLPVYPIAIDVSSGLVKHLIIAREFALISALPTPCSAPAWPMGWCHVPLGQVAASHRYSISTSAL